MMIKRWLAFLIFIAFAARSDASFAQNISEEAEYSLDLNSPTVTLPKVFKPNVDLSGRGFHRDITLPQTMSSRESLETWKTDMGLNNFYRIQFNLWEIQQVANDKPTQEKFLNNNYEEVIKLISDSGGTVILNLFGTPNGMGKVLDKNSPPHNLKAYKELVKNIIRRLSCEKRYNIWYEVWNAPDQEDFFLGERSEYLNLYRMVAEAVKELRQEFKMHIPLGGPSVSSWFRNIEPNTVLSPENSLIYELIKYCYSYHLPLDFISWHAYSSDPQEEKQNTIYGKPPAQLIREWLSYFKFDEKIPLVIDEWNFDGPANILAERGKNSYVCASYIPSRLKNMQEAKIGYQTYFCLEDFGGTKVEVNRNLGVFSFDFSHPDSKSYPKATYNVLRMLNMLGDDLFTGSINDDFLGVIATKSPDYYCFLFYNYIDPQAAMNYISRNIVNLSNSERKSVLNIVKSDRMEKILSGAQDIASLRISNKAKNMFNRALELNNQVKRFAKEKRKIKFNLSGSRDIYALSKYIIENNCARDCPFKPVSEQNIDFSQGYLDTVEMSPYSVQLWVFRKKPPEENLPAASENKQELKQPSLPNENASDKKELSPEEKKEQKIEAILQEKKAEEQKDAEIK